MDDFKFPNNQPLSDDNRDKRENLSYYNSPFYIPNEQKQKKHKTNLLSYIAVALISSLAGGITVGFIILAAKPVVEPVVDKAVGSLFPGIISNVSTGKDNNGQSLLKKIEIGSYDSPVVAIAEKVGPSIVGIRVVYNETVPFSFFGDIESEAQGEGSGIIVRKDGYILTNYHVIEKAYSASGKKQTGKVLVFLPNSKDEGQDGIPAKIVGGDRSTDIAVLKIEQDNLPEAELGNSSEVKVGELAVAIGNPLGLEFAGSVTAGVVSAVNRTVEIDGRTLNLIQTDAAINPGNSGGALVNPKGQVIGINTVKMASAGVEGIGFAIPIDEVKLIMEQLIQYKYVKGRPQIGIGGVSIDENKSRIYDIPVGIYVQQVTPFSGAERAGIQVGDVIVEFAGKSVKTIVELNEIKKSYKAGDTVKVVIIRDGVRKVINLKLTEEK